MWLHRATAQSIAGDPQFVLNLQSDHRMRHVNHKAPSRGDVRSWRRSVTHLAQELQDCGLGHVYMHIEYEVDPALTGQAAAPIDVLLAGSHPKTGESSFIAVELKQWDHVGRVDGDPTRVRVPGYKKAKAHPAVQVDVNRQRLLKHLALFSDQYATLRALAYLHNLNGEDTQWITHYTPGPDARALTGITPDSLREYLLAHLATTDEGGAAAKAAQLLANSRVIPASPLQDVFGEVLAGRISFNLIDDQREAFDQITAALERPTGSTQDVFLIKGRPGTGKSVIAVHLLRWAAAKGYECRYVSGGTAARTTFQKKSRGHGRLFITLKALAQRHEPKSLDIVLVDEAHRLTRFPLVNSAGTMLEGEETIDVVLSRARIPVFFIDEDQRVRPNEIISARQIEEHARRIHGVSFQPHVLHRPMRGAGSPTYDTWVKRLLGGAKPEPLPWGEGDPFELRVAESPSRMEELLRGRIVEGHSARMTAGFCWKWSPPRADGTLVDDVKIGGWHRPWNAKRLTAHGDVPPSLLWATAPGGFEQLGCVYTAQGLEYDWAGVILGNDLLWRDGGWRAVREASEDRKLKSRSKSHEEFATSVRNAYTVLFTRAMCGAVVYSTDPETQEMLRGLIG
ncbi:DUF2075 domain-containing protein [Actinospica durhamensis]|uniref:DUF2075 domain-containing protein n=1 Tax=Actinospica durhamensis TaxID=1508375 RepID=A0A941EXK5_9ACTN|nr:DNA/RNA helicase domain-containing protein [Actinospica durhamensis]MBR7835804.1 DUF2075 domain-containing protein [Actinospica durhamensis]